MATIVLLTRNDIENHFTKLAKLYDKQQKKANKTAGEMTALKDKLAQLDLPVKGSK